MDYVRYYNESAAHLVLDYEKMRADRLAEFDPSKPSKILDVGAGSGRDAAWLANRGHTVIAFEPSHGMMEEGKKLHPDANIHWFESGLPYPTLYKPITQGELDVLRKCDLIIVSCVTHALNNNEIKASLINLSRDFLADDGALLVCDNCSDDHGDKGWHLADLKDYCAEAGLTNPEYSYQPEPNGILGSGFWENALMKKLK